MSARFAWLAILASMTIARERLDETLFLRTDLSENQRLIAGQIAAQLNPGDALFFHARTFHAAGRNYTDLPKFSLVFTYRPADNRPLAGMGRYCGAHRR